MLSSLYELLPALNEFAYPISMLPATSDHDFIKYKKLPFLQEMFKPEYLRNQNTHSKITTIVSEKIIRRPFLFRDVNINFFSSMEQCKNKNFKIMFINGNFDFVQVYTKYQRSVQSNLAPL